MNPPRPVPLPPATVGAYLASLAGTHAPTTIRRRLAALGKMHRFNDLPWNPGHRDIQEPLQGLLRKHGISRQGMGGSGDFQPPSSDNSTSGLLSAGAGRLNGLRRPVLVKRQRAVASHFQRGHKRGVGAECQLPADLCQVQTRL